MFRKYIEECYCHTCKKSFNKFGIARHRAMHRDRKENCTISYDKKGTIEHKFKSS